MSEDAVLARAQALLQLDRPADVLALLAGDTSERGRGMRVLALLRLDPREAVEEVERLVADCPGSPEAHRLRAWALLGVNRAAEAVVAARTGLGLDPHSVDLLAVLSTAYRVSGRPQDARTTAEQLLAAAPWWAQAHVLLGAAAAAQRHPVLAEQAYTRALAIDPHDAQALEGLARHRATQGRRADAAGLFLAAGRERPSRRLAAVAGGLHAARATSIVVLLFFLGGATGERPAVAAASCAAGLLVSLCVAWGVLWSHARHLPAGFRRAVAAEQRRVATGLLVLTGAYTTVVLLPLALTHRAVVGPGWWAVLLAVVLATVAVAVRRARTPGGLRRPRVQDLVGWLTDHVRDQRSLSRDDRSRRSEERGSAGRSPRSPWAHLEPQWLVTGALPSCWRRALSASGALNALCCTTAWTVLLTAPRGLLIGSPVLLFFSSVADSMPRSADRAGAERLVVLAADGRPLGAGRHVLRSLLRLALFPVLLVEGAVSGRGPRRLLHDRGSGATVVRARPATVYDAA